MKKSIHDNGQEHQVSGKLRSNERHRHHPTVDIGKIKKVADDYCTANDASCQRGYYVTDEKAYIKDLAAFRS